MDRSGSHRMGYETVGGLGGGNSAARMGAKPCCFSSMAGNSELFNNGDGPGVDPDADAFDSGCFSSIAAGNPESFNNGDGLDPVASSSASFSAIDDASFSAITPETRRLAAAACAMAMLSMSWIHSR